MSGAERRAQQPERDPFAGTAYRMRRLLGAGGMGQVFEVEHLKLRKLFVAKVLRAELVSDAGVVDRMRVEAQALAALSHPNLVAVTDFGDSVDGRPFFVMERLSGRTLGDQIRAEGPLPLERAIGIVRQILRALSAAHSVGLIHRDVKLDNVFLHEDPNGERIVKLLDFGVAKVLPRAVDLGLLPPALPTTEGAVVGTPRYVSPEQVLGQPIDARSDLYGVGLVLYTIIAGRGPFAELQGMELLRAQASASPPPPSLYAPSGLPPTVDAIVLRALAKRPEDRFQSAEQFDAELARVAAPTAHHVAKQRTASQPGNDAVVLGTPTAPNPPRFSAGAKPSETNPDPDFSPDRTMRPRSPLLPDVESDTDPGPRDAPGLQYAPTVEARSATGRAPTAGSATEILERSASLRALPHQLLPTRTNPGAHVKAVARSAAVRSQSPRIAPRDAPARGSRRLGVRYAIIASCAALTALIGIAFTGESTSGLLLTFTAAIVVALLAAIVLNRLS